MSISTTKVSPRTFLPQLKSIRPPETWSLKSDDIKDEDSKDSLGSLKSPLFYNSNKLRLKIKLPILSNIETRSKKTPEEISILNFEYRKYLGKPLKPSLFFNSNKSSPVHHEDLSNSIKLASFSNKNLVSSRNINLVQTKTIQKILELASRNKLALPKRAIKVNEPLRKVINIRFFEGKFK